MCPEEENKKIKKCLSHKLNERIWKKTRDTKKNEQYRDFGEYSFFVVVAVMALTKTTKFSGSPFVWRKIRQAVARYT